MTTSAPLHCRIRVKGYPRVRLRTTAEAEVCLNLAVCGRAAGGALVEGKGVGDGGMEVESGNRNSCAREALGSVV